MDPIRRRLDFLGAIIGINIKSALALRGSFLLQAGFMLINNAVFFTVWLLLFQRYPEIKGWHLQDLMTLQAVVLAAYSMVMFFFGGVRHIAAGVMNGDIDIYLTKPRSVLLQLLTSHSNSSAVGDFATFLGMIFLSHRLTLGTLPIWFVGIFCATVIYLAANVLFQCLAFWLKDADGIVRILFEYLISFATFPQTVYTGFLKVVMFTILPAGFIGLLPVELLKDFQWIDFVLLLLATVTFSIAAIFTFKRGLRRYESGNLVGFRSV